MNREEKENIKYFEEMCDTLSNKKIMFREWENFYKKLNEVITSNNDNEKYRSYRKYMMTLKTFSNNKNS